MRKTALISVSNKTGLALLAQTLVQKNIKILSTGGTASYLKKEGISVTDVSAITGFPEIMAGRVKTLHPMIHGGILARRGQDDAIMAETGIGAIDIVIVNLYPFSETVAKGAERDEIIEKIDIGGPSLIRAAAKNHAFVTVVTRPEDYDFLRQKLANDEEISFEDRQYLASRAFEDSAAYDTHIAQWMRREMGREEEAPRDEEASPPGLPAEKTVTLNRVKKLRYGENPHQLAGLYHIAGEKAHGLIAAEVLQGKEPGYNNYADADTALNLAFSLDPGGSDEAICCIIKHATPCGVAKGSNAEEAFERALACDSVSAFGGVVGFNREVDAKTANRLCGLFLELVIAPDFSSEALSILSQKPNLRLLKCSLPKEATLEWKAIAGGLLIQEADDIRPAPSAWRCVTEKTASEAEQQDLAFAWVIAGYARSNAIVIARQGLLEGLGAGQTSRIISARLAVTQMKERQTIKQESKASLVAASDGFFPFADGVETLIDAGISALVQPGGSNRDEEVIKTANEAGIAMMMTGKRHFRH